MRKLFMENLVERGLDSGVKASAIQEKQVNRRTNSAQADEASEYLTSEENSQLSDAIPADVAVENLQKVGDVKVHGNGFNDSATFHGKNETVASEATGPE
ncbi:unnamed protein product [Rhodiola kirilowii]